MHAIKVYITAKDFDDVIKSRLSVEDSERFAECYWVPVKIEMTNNFEIEVTAVPAL